MGCPWQPYSLGGEGTASEATSTISAWFRPSASARPGSRGTLFQGTSARRSLKWRKSGGRLCLNGRMECGEKPVTFRGGGCSSSRCTTCAPAPATRKARHRSARHVEAIVYAAAVAATSQRGSSAGSRAPDLGPFEVVQGATWLHVMRHVNEQPAVRSVGGSAILSGA